MQLIDWRAAASAEVHACFYREARHWRDAFAWDTDNTWLAVEYARLTRGLPGCLVVDDAGVVHWWTFFHPENGALHVGALVASNPAATRLLTAALARAADRTTAGRVAGFMPARAPGVDRILTGSGFAASPYVYLSRTLSDVTMLADEAGEAWQPSDLPLAGALLSEAYDRAEISRFAHEGRPEDWTLYTQRLIDHDGCGVFDASATRVAREGTRFAAIVLATSIASDTGHIAQVAVAPERRGRQLATRLLRSSFRAMAAQGRRRVTLLVADDNASARALYHRLGFHEQGRFLAVARSV